MPQARLLLLCAPLLSACASLPPSMTEREDPIKAVKEIFSWRYNSIGARVSDRDVIEVTPEHILYKDNGKLCRLAFRDIAMVDREIRETFAEPYENARLFLTKDSASIDSTVVVKGPFSFGRPHIALPGRPQGTLARLKGSLDRLRLDRSANEKAANERAAKKKAPAPTKQDPPSVKAPPKPAPKVEAVQSLKKVPAPSSDKGDELERKLSRLKKWFEQGLITQSEYDAKRKALLESY